MPDYLFLMHDDAPPGKESSHAHDGTPYLDTLQALSHLRGGSAVGQGICVRKTGAAPAITGHITGILRVCADDLDHAAILVAAIPFTRPAEA